MASDADILEFLKSIFTDSDTRADFAANPVGTFESYGMGDVDAARINACATVLANTPGALPPATAGAILANSGNFSGNVGGTYGSGGNVGSIGGYNAGPAFAGAPPALAGAIQETAAITAASVYAPHITNITNFDNDPTYNNINNIAYGGDVNSAVASGGGVAGNTGGGDLVGATGRSVAGISEPGGGDITGATGDNAAAVSGEGGVGTLNTGTNTGVLGDHNVGSATGAGAVASGAAEGSTSALGFPGSVNLGSAEGSATSLGGPAAGGGYAEGGGDAPGGIAGATVAGDGGQISGDGGTNVDVGQAANSPINTAGQDGNAIQNAPNVASVGANFNEGADQAAPDTGGPIIDDFGTDPLQPVQDPGMVMPDTSGLPEGAYADEAPADGGPAGQDYVDPSEPRTDPAGRAARAVTGADGGARAGDGAVAAAPADGIPGNDLSNGALALVDLGLQAARAYGRPDLEARLSAARARLTDPAVRVMVVGEFKQGKSSLVNALVQHAVCPVDDDVATSVPTGVHYADAPEAAVVHEPEGAGEPRREPIDPATVGDYASEAGNPANVRRVRSVDIGVPSPVLAGGLVLVDTPGVGGLGSVHSAITMAALPMADALLFVTDASQELTAPELDFLRRAVELCPNVFAVLTKIDFYPEWRRISEIDRGRLDDAGLPIPILPVSSALHDVAIGAGATDVEAESGFPALVAHLLRGVVFDAARLEARAAANDMLAVAGQLDGMFRSERAALEDPDKIAAMVAELQAAKARADELKSHAARWQVTLGDGLGDLTAEVDYDLRTRTRNITREAEEAIDASDPSRVWDEFEPWLYRKVAYEVAENYSLLARRTAEVGERVADHFRAAELELGVSMELAVPVVSTERLGVDARLDVNRPGAGSQGLAALRGGYGGMMMFGMLSSVAGLTMMNPVSLVLGLVLGRRTQTEERDRMLATHRQQAKASVRRYVDEASFQVGNDSREALRRVQRSLRDEFEARAAELQRTTAERLAAVQAAAQSDEQTRVNRLRDVDAELGRIGGVIEQARELQAAAAVGG